PTGGADDPHTITPGSIEVKGVGGKGFRGVVVRVVRRDRQPLDIVPFEILAYLNAEVAREPAAVRRYRTGTVDHPVDGVRPRPGVSPEVQRLLLPIEAVVEPVGSAVVVDILLPEVGGLLDRGHTVGHCEVVLRAGCVLGFHGN